MAIDLKKLTELIGLEVDLETATEDDFKTAFDKTYIGRQVAGEDADIINKVTGRRLGGIETALKRNLKNLGFEFTPEEIKDKKLEDVIELAFTEKVGKTFEQLKADATKGDDAKLTKLQKEADDWKKKHSELTGIYSTLETELAETKATTEKRIKDFQIGQKINEVKSKVPFSKNASPLTLKGFDLEFNEKYGVDLDETGELIVLNKKDNSRVVDGAKYETLENLLKKEALAAQILEVNSGGGQQQRKTTTTTFTPPANDGKPAHFTNERMQQHLDKLKAAQGA